MEAVLDVCGAVFRVAHLTASSVVLKDQDWVKSPTGLGMVILSKFQGEGGISVTGTLAKADNQRRKAHYLQGGVSASLSRGRPLY